MKRIKLLVLILAMFMPMMVNADTVEIDGIYYNLVSADKIAEVTKNPSYYHGDIIIPEKVTYQGVDYDVTSIGSKAFDGNDIFYQLLIFQMVLQQLMRRCSVIVGI